LPLHHFIVDLEEVIFPIRLSDLVFQALRILELLAEVIVFLRDLLRGPLDELVLPLNLGKQLLHLPLKVNNVWIRCEERLHDLVGDLFGSAGVALNAHMREGPDQPIVGDIFLEERVLRKDSGIGAVSQDLIAYGIGGSTYPFVR
jgi:hypothetical protein